MANFTETFDETEEIFNKVLKTTSIPSFVSFKLVCNLKSKKAVAIFKANDILSHLTGFDVVIVVNEKILNDLENKQKEMLFDEALAEVYYDMAKSIIKLERPDLQTFSGIIRKYTLEEYNRLQECVKAIIQQSEDKEVKKGAN